MASLFRYRSEDVKYDDLATDSSHAIEHGDLVGVSGGYAEPASQFATAALFAAAFAGSATRKTGLQSGEVLFRLALSVDPGWTTVASTGVFEYDCDAHVWADGDLVAVAVANGAAINQKVASAGSYTTAIGTAVVPYNQIGKSVTSVQVRIRATKTTHNGIQSGQ